VPKDFIDEIIEREGGSKITNDPSDHGGRTQYGIAEKSNPEVWADDKVTYEEAREIYSKKYLKPFKGLENHLAFEQMVDFGVTSGPGLVIQKLQEIILAEVDGIIGPDTLAKVSLIDERELNNLLLKERVKMIGRICSKNLSQVRFLNGWLNRSFEFLVL
jgi:lysozyme family protein